ncbi:MAG: methyltransferase domain-containing protein [Elusimicrobia bacterium]|nr:methyltransferase domain-containing protein [Elusimicrobiota bacterium]
MKRSLLALLCCPNCRGRLDLVEGQGQGKEVVSGVLACQDCPARFPIRRGIPRFLSAERGSESPREDIDHFGYQWTRFGFLSPTYEAQFLDWISPVERSFFPGKTVLDAGCGKGRHLVCARQFGAATVVGMDASDGVETAYEHVRGMDNAHVVQADIHHPPFKPVFDYAYSVGVLHHLPDPEAGFRSILRVLRPGGRVSVWVYGLENNRWVLWLRKLLWSGVVARLGPSGRKSVSWAATALALWPALKLVYAPMGRLGLAKRLFYGDYLCYISGFSFRDVWLIVLDHISPGEQHYVSGPEIARWFRDASLKDVVIEHHNRNSWRGFARLSSPPRRG